jgi:hypothetical protein
MSAPAPPPPVKKFVPRARTPPASAPAAQPDPPKSDTAARVQQEVPAPQPLASAGSISAQSSIARQRPDDSVIVANSRTPAAAAASSAPAAARYAPPAFDKEDVEALRSENRLLQTRLAAFLEFQQSTTSSSSSSDAISVRGMGEAEVGALFNAMKARIRQLELALAWECSRREEAEERCFAIMRRSAAASRE